MASVTRTGIVDADGVERAVDVIVMATGFQPANYLARLRVVGRGGRTLQEHWADEPRAYLGITVPGFPNFFMLYGPGTNGGELVVMLESQAEYAVRAMRRMIRERVTAVEVKPSFEARWYRWLQSRMEGTSWTMTNNYFKSPTGKIVTQWPYSNLEYRALDEAVRPRVGDHPPASRVSRERCHLRRRTCRLNHSSWSRMHCLVTGASGAKWWNPWQAPG